MEPNMRRLQTGTADSRGPFGRGATGRIGPGGRRVRRRAAAAVAVAALAVATAPATGAAAEAGSTVQATPFSDLGGLDDATRRAIRCIHDTGIARGTSATTYSPDRPVTRRQMALFLSRLLGVIGVPNPPEIVDPNFSDLAPDDEVSSAVALLYSLSITKGRTDTEFAPSMTVTRRQMALFLSRLLTAAGVSPVSGLAPGFDDTAVLDAASRSAIAQMIVDDVMRGLTDERFAPSEAVTREHMALFLSGALAVAQSRSSPPRTLSDACRPIVSAYEAVARPSTVRIALDPPNPEIGESVQMRATVSDRGGLALAGLPVRLVRDGEVASDYAETGADGTVDFTIASPESDLAGDASLELRVGDAVIASSTTAIAWSPLDLSDATLSVVLEVDDRRPTVGDEVEAVATVLDDAGEPLHGAVVDFFLDGATKASAMTGSDGQATFAYDTPQGPLNEGGYDSVQAHVVTTQSASRPVGVFWQPAESRRVTISVSPDASHSSAARTITAAAFDGDTPLAGRRLDLHIDGTVAASATTDAHGVATFTRSSPLHGPFDVARAALGGVFGVVSDEIVISWPMRTRGIDSRNDWQLAWSDEFNGDSLNRSRWTASNDCPPVYLSCNTDRPENVYLTDGMLHLRSLREPIEGINTWQGCGEQTGPVRCTPGREQVKDFTSARVNSVEYFTFGRIEILARLPQGHGTFFAIWMKPRRDSPYGTGHAAGELDIAEGVNIGRGGNPRGYVDGQLPGRGWSVHHFVKTGYPTTNPVTLTHLPVNPAESFHLYAMEWDAASVRFYVDDQRVMTIPSSDWFADPEGDGVPVDNPYAPFDEPFNLIISNTVGGWAVHNTPGNLVPDTTPFPTEFVVDYVRYYQCRPASDTGSLGPGQGCETR